VQPSLGSAASKSQGSLSHSHDSKNAAQAVINDPSKSSQSRSMPSVGTGAGQIFSDIGLYKGVVVALKHIKKDHMQITRQVLLEFNQVDASFPLYQWSGAAMLRADPRSWGRAICARST